MKKDIGKDKTVEVVRFEDRKIETAKRCYNFKVTDWIDRTDSPETIKVHSNIPLLGLTLNKLPITISKPAQQAMDEAA